MSSWCSSSASSLLVSTSSSAITRSRSATRLRSTARSSTASSIVKPRGAKIRSTSVSSCHAFSSHSSGGSPTRKPASASACWARSASCGRSIRSRSLTGSGPPYAHTAMLPPSMNGISAACRTGTDARSAATIPSNDRASISPLMCQGGTRGFGALAVARCG